MEKDENLENFKKINDYIFEKIKDDANLLINKKRFEEIEIFLNELKKTGDFYKSLIPTLFDIKKSYIKDNNSNFFNIEEIKKIKNTLELDLLCSNLNKFLSLINNSNFIWLENIKEGILNESREGFTWNASAFFGFIDINNRILNFLYLGFLNFEYAFKNKLLKTLLKNKKNVPFKEINTKVDSYKNFFSKKTENEKRNPEDFLPKYFNEINYIDLLEILNIIKSDELLKTIIIEILGNYNFKNFNSSNLSTIKDEIIKNLSVIKEMRNKVMHFHWIMPTNKENLLMDSLKSLNYLSHLNVGNEGRLGDKIYWDIVYLISGNINVNNDSRLLKYFSKNIFNYDLIK